VILAVVTEIYLCDVCSCQEILRRSGGRRQVGQIFGSTRAGLVRVQFDDAKELGVLLFPPGLLRLFDEPEVDGETSAALEAARRLWQQQRLGRAAGAEELATLERAAAAAAAAKGEAGGGGQPGDGWARNFMAQRQPSMAAEFEYGRRQLEKERRAALSGLNAYAAAEAAAHPADQGALAGGGKYRPRLGSMAIGTLSGSTEFYLAIIAAPPRSLSIFLMINVSDYLRCHKAFTYDAAQVQGCGGRRRRPGGQA
jgi:hypothetical protein